MVAVGTLIAERHRVAGGGRPPPAPTERGVRISRTTLFGSWFTAFTYMRRRESRGFFVIKHSLLPFKRLTRAQACIDGTDGPLLGRDERSTPRARRAAPEREGLTAKARAQPQWCQAITPQM